ncbi:CubicO group peptidase (beta-lactamase class C family) [Rhodopseudomonas faecalis]|uniref:CubicO group peptidase (Beta-lactamase class C family) n=1 Tax=Rhodopseudomonas faecalis TaxID=99655 RepID=A0A318TCV3_9BRAD|nr:CubicO group peptidase (beta-lactamase class C family) [Rhodopseudomonas faecalis]TAH68603.1 MAG: class A beta-lactamase-related serine hydrolase [Rhodopseudomonas palustris]
MPSSVSSTSPQPAKPTLPQDRPDALGLSSQRLQKMSDAFKREIDKGTTPGVIILVARRGAVAWFEAMGRQSPTSDRPMSPDSIFRIFSMTKPIVSIGAMQLVEDGELLLDDPLTKYIPEFSNQSVAVLSGGNLELRPLNRPITIQDLLRHTSGLAYDHIGVGPVQKMYQQAQVNSRKITNAEHASRIASLPLLCQPGTAWNYSRSTDVIGRVIELVSGRSLGTFLTERVLTPLGMNDTGFHTAAANKSRIAEPFATDPWTGDQMVLFDPLEVPVMESAGGGLVSTTMDYARFCQMLLNGGTLEGTRIIGRKTLQLMTANHLAPNLPTDASVLPPGHGFGLGFAVRTGAGFAPFSGSAGQFFWSGIAGTFFWVDPVEQLFAVMMSQGPGQHDYYRSLVRDVVYAAVE